MAAVSEGDKNGTSPGMDLQQAMFDELRSIRHSIEKINGRIEQVEKKVGQVVTDLYTVHQLQRTYTSRLTVIEQMCVDTPLKSSPPGTGNDEGGRLDP